MSENTDFTLVKTESVQQIARITPDAYGKNSLAVQKCTELGNALLAKINSHGMDDTIDQECASFIERAKTAVKRMNERRAPITKLFDQIRSAFTAMEGYVDVAKKGSVPYTIQQHRNAYAARKREEAERARREEMMRQQREAALRQYRIDVENDFKRQFDNLVSASINTLSEINASITLGNFDAKAGSLQEFKIELSNDWFLSLPSYAHRPMEIQETEATEIRKQILNALSKQFKEQYKFEIGEYRDTIIDALPSKRNELQRMAKANDEEKARIEAELKAKEAAEVRRLDEERRSKEEEAEAARQVKAQASEMDGLFSQAAVASPARVASPAAYQPKTAVRLRVKADGPDGFLAIFSMWWSKEGVNLPAEEMEKIFKKQITFVERLANDKTNPETISSPFVTYEEEVKAK